jgi:hypothetical protein
MQLLRVIESYLIDVDMSDGRIPDKETLDKATYIYGLSQLLIDVCIIFEFVDIIFYIIGIDFGIQFVCGLHESNCRTRKQNIRRNRQQVSIDFTKLHWISSSILVGVKKN